ncbi:MAG: sulfite exporter TauE/SafE family protein [Nitrospirae bacterium]|uniref:sulfite exporter TauE/SafE family protein n=1 Tax=Candidatus Magnetobacterium casense TaxID=1455061 RepID=UPI00058DAA0F|nr:sulfite exporter TauE/SafE family protein [Candidatus Magnetobacterium casensis]MBF0336271.1 sulfite exporter TauE/SafE family protein [Nitrospirota bacterium]
MELLSVVFPVSGVETNVLLPPLVAMVISVFTSMGGVSGAFLLLPFQMSVLGYTAPSVSGTNHVYNIVAIPSGVWQYIKEGRMAWPVTWVVVLGTLPGVFIGYYVRVHYLPDPKPFKLFVGCVLLYIGSRLLKGIFPDKTDPAVTAANPLEAKFKLKAEQIRQQQSRRMAAGLPPEAVIKTVSISLRRIEYEFWSERFSFNPLSMFALALVVGVIGGAYGIGGGAIIAPFCVAVFHLPVYTIAGAALMGTFITSFVGAVFFTLIPMATAGVSATPDWMLGGLFGLGGFAGMYIGARLQKFVPQKHIKILIGLLIVMLAMRYITQFFF